MREPDFHVFGVAGRACYGQRLRHAFENGRIRGDYRARRRDRVERKPEIVSVRCWHNFFLLGSSPLSKSCLVDYLIDAFALHIAYDIFVLDAVSQRFLVIGVQRVEYLYLAAGEHRFPGRRRQGLFFYLDNVAVVYYPVSLSAWVSASGSRLEIEDEPSLFLDRRRIVDRFPDHGFDGDDVSVHRFLNVFGNACFDDIRA